MNRRQNRRAVIWSVGLTLGVLIWGLPTPAARGQEQTRQQQYSAVVMEYQRLRGIAPQPMGEPELAKAEDKLVGQMVRVVEVNPGDQLSLQTLTMLFDLKRAAPEPRALRFFVEHHLKNPGFGQFLEGHWTYPTPGRTALLRRLADVQELPAKQRGLVALLLARDALRQAGETGDADLSRHAERYADRFEKDYPNRDVYVGAAIDPAAVRRLLDTVRKAGIGRAAPNLQANDVQNKKFNLADLRGKAVLVYFYTGASTMYPKVRAALEPHLARLKGRPVALVIVTSTSKTLLLKKVNLDPAPPTVLSSVGGIMGTTQQEWGVTSMPTAVLVDAQGTIRYRFAPADPQVMTLDLQRVGTALDQLVAEAVRK